MMSEYYDHYHRWEPLAEFHFKIDNGDDLYDDNYIYCLCSRVLIRDGVKTYNTEKEDGSESDVEALHDTQSQEWEDQSHVHFSLDTSYKVKCEKDEGASCYCSASHTDNYCSTDEQDPGQFHGASHVLQPSDSGADLTYQDCHSDYTTHDKLEKMDQDYPVQGLSEIDENYFSEDTWEKFWAVNGERLIWASWIKKYSDYINPAYLDENNDLVMDENNIPKQHSVDQIFNKDSSDTNLKNSEEESIRERKFSYDSKVNPYRKGHFNQNLIEKTDKNNELTCNRDDTWLPIGRRRSCSEHDRMLSPRTLATTDSMTNVTKITLSSYDVTSSHVTSESTPTDDYSVSSSTSDDQSNDQTRIINIDDCLNQEPSEELDTEQYWQLLWKKHFGEQYALHYANYIESHDTENKDVPFINVEMVQEKKVEEKSADIECENSEGNSQEMPSVIEVQTQVDRIKLEEKTSKPKKRSKRANNRYISSVGVLLQNLLKEEQMKSEHNEVVEAGEESKEKTTPVNVDVIDGARDGNIQESLSNSNLNSYSYNDGDDDPPEEKPLTLKRSHEIDEEEVTSEKIKATFEIMGFCLNPETMPKGQLVYRKRLGRLRPPRYKRFGAPRKTYFDDDGNPYQVDQAQDSQDEREMQTDDDCASTDINTDPVCSNQYDVHNQTTDVEDDRDLVLEAAETPFPPDGENSFSDAPDNEETEKNDGDVTGNVVNQYYLSNPVDPMKRRRRPNRYWRLDAVTVPDYDIMPGYMRDKPKMFKYWMKRLSLFHKFDEGIKLDLESWFSVTPENVARHIAEKCRYDVVLDAFCGAGGNTIQFAMTCKKVIAMDIDPVKIELAKHNAGIYGVADRIEFIVGDFFKMAPVLKADMVFLSPPWGGPDYSEHYQYDLETMLEPKPASELMEVARTISSNVALYLPRNTRSDQLLALAKDAGGSVEIEQNYLDKRFVAITAYFY